MTTGKAARIWYRCCIRRGRGAEDYVRRNYRRPPRPPCLPPLGRGGPVAPAHHPSCSSRGDVSSSSGLCRSGASLWPGSGVVGRPPVLFAQRARSAPCPSAMAAPFLCLCPAPRAVHARHGARARHAAREQHGRPPVDKVPQGTKGHGASGAPHGPRSACVGARPYAGARRTVQTNRTNIPYHTAPVPDPPASSPSCWVGIGHGTETLRFGTCSHQNIIIVPASQHLQFSIFFGHDIGHDRRRSPAHLPPAATSTAATGMRPMSTS